jgi:ubiquinone/menaquinone biosynthesis C-methylase UbiE
VGLVDPVARHLEQARAASARQPSSPVERIEAGDARSIPVEDSTQDAVLLMGPLYHLPEPAERARALREARRVLKARGVLAAAAISRFASLLDGLARGFIDDPAFVAILQEDLASGRHRNPTGNLEYFTTAHFHRPEELAAEVADAGFRDVRVLAVQGPGWIAPDLDARLSDPARRARLMGILRDVEISPASLAMTPHLVAVAGAPGGPA